MTKRKYIGSGGWRTVESFWNAKGTAFFQAPVGAQIKIRYGVGWFGFDSQKQNLDGVEYRKLVVGLSSLGLARMQIKVSQTTDVTYDVYGDGLARLLPEIQF